MTEHGIKSLQKTTSLTSACRVFVRRKASGASLAAAEPALKTFRAKGRG